MVAANGTTIIFPPYTDAQPGNKCIKCPPQGCPQPGSSLDNGTDITFAPQCGNDYAGSLYQKLVRYAIQACMRPSDVNAMTDTSRLPDTLLQDVNATMDLVKVSMASALKMECERQGGHWIAAQWTDSITTETGIKLFLQFYNETGANKKWGYCADPDSVSAYYTGISNNETTDSSQSNTNNNGQT